MKKQMTCRTECPSKEGYLVCCYSCADSDKCQSRCPAHMKNENPLECKDRDE